jgi:hypothetical protein
MPCGMRASIRGLMVGTAGHDRRAGEPGDTHEEASPAVVAVAELSRISAARPRPGSARCRSSARQGELDMSIVFRRGTATLARTSRTVHRGPADHTASHARRRPHPHRVRRADPARTDRQHRADRRVDRHPGRRRGRQHSPDTAVPDARPQRPVLRLAARQHPELLSTYADLYAHGSRTPRHYRDLVRARVNQALQRHGLPIPDDTTSDKFALLGRGSTVTEPTAPTLF